MKELLEKATAVMIPLGYRKKGSSFWRSYEGVYTLVHFQKGAHGGGYYFVNIGIHPVGLPALLSGQLNVPEMPKDYECILRQRIEQIVLSPATQRFREGLVAVDDMTAGAEILECIQTDAKEWIDGWASLNRLAHVMESEVLDMLTVVPLLKKKAFWMLKSYCSTKIGEIDQARHFLKKFTTTQVEGYDFEQVEKHLTSIIENGGRLEQNEMSPRAVDDDESR